jgi:antitoxin ParD1/3/4
VNVSLTPELEQYISQKVASGLYHSASEVIRESLRLLKDQDALREIRLNELRQQIQAGISSGEPQSLNVEDVIERGKKRHAPLSKASSPDQRG